MQGIELAYKGRQSMLRAIFGGKPDEPGPKKEPPKMTAKLFKAMFERKHG